MYFFRLFFFICNRSEKWGVSLIIKKNIIMKKTILSLIVLAAIGGLASCKKGSTDCNLIAAKIIRYDCDRVIFQLLTTESIGDAKWQDIQTGLQYSNVVSYYNTCTIANLTNGNMDTLFVQIKKDDREYHSLDCIQCKAISSNPPQIKVDFTEISKSTCVGNLRGVN